MRETPEEIAELQRMFDAHLARANPHMTAIVTPERRLTAEQVVRYLDGTRHVAFATVTPKGQPRVSPLDTLLLHGRFTLSTDVTASRIAHLRANAACSAVYMEADRIAVVVNGRANDCATLKRPCRDAVPLLSWGRVGGRVHRPD